jgi:hypothetical protein
MRRTFLGGKIRTLDPNLPEADFIVVADGRVEEVGRGKWTAPIESDIEEVELDGGTLLPGFIDAHIHFSQFAWEASLHDLSGVCGLGHLWERLVSCDERRVGGWLVGRRLPPGVFLEVKEYRGMALSDVVLNGPLIIGTADMHTALLDRAGFEAVCSGGILDMVMDDLVEVCGDLVVLHEGAAIAAWRWLESSIKALDEAAVVDAVERLHEVGITGIYTFERLHDLVSLREVEAFRRGLRAAGGFYDEDLDSVLEKGGAAFGRGVTPGGLKLFVDGALGSRTAWLFEPYDDTGTCGVEATPLDRLRSAALRACEGGLPICLHAIGDRAVSTALEVVEGVSGVGAGGQHRHRVEHIQLIRREDIGRLADLRVVASVQPLHIVEDRVQAEKAWGERCGRSYPVRSLLEAGVSLAFGSDAPAGQADPMAAVRVAATRRLEGEEDPGEVPWYRDERISVEEAVTAHTVGSAGACGWRDAGVITKGSRADFVALSHDPFRSEVDLVSARVRGTIVGGEVVYWVSKTCRSGSRDTCRHRVEGRRGMPRPSRDLH